MTGMEGDVAAVTVTVTVTAPEAPVLPVAAGDWVATNEESAFQLGRVKNAYMFDGDVCVDVVLYGTDGNRIGRTSPAEGGPRTFEPSLTYGGGNWRRIEKPDFPIERKMQSVPSGEPGKFYLRFDAHGSVTPKPERTVALDRTRPKNRAMNARAPVLAPVPDGNGSEIERAALMRAAQELRDLAKAQPSMAEMLKARAAELEADAAKLA